MLTLLLAEADQELRDSYRWYLSKHGYQIETAVNGLDCLTKLRKLMPDHLILDLDLLWGGGNGVLGVMREDERLCHIPVTILSAPMPVDMLNHLLETRLIVQALFKPIRMADLLECLNARTLAELRQEACV
jgi:DNA-binding response OmpR family regulator